MRPFYKTVGSLLIVFLSFCASAQPARKKMNNGMGTLEFEYATHPHKKVSEYSARVQRRFTGDTSSTFQRCDTMHLYKAGNYYIEINTLPIARYNADIDSGSATLIIITEPGIVAINNKTEDAVITLYRPLGAKLAKFYQCRLAAGYTLDLSLRQGSYVLRYHTKNTREEDTTPIRFEVKPDQPATVILPP